MDNDSIKIYGEFLGKVSVKKYKRVKFVEEDGEKEVYGPCDIIGYKRSDWQGFYKSINLGKKHPDNRWCLKEKGFALKCIFASLVDKGQVSVYEYVHESMGMKFLNAYNESNSLDDGFSVHSNAGEEVPYYILMRDSFPPFVLKIGNPLTRKRRARLARYLWDSPTVVDSLLITGKERYYKKNDLREIINDYNFDVIKDIDDQPEKKGQDDNDWWLPDVKEDE